jgi:hypothetical protein
MLLTTWVRQGEQHRDSTCYLPYLGKITMGRTKPYAQGWLMLDLCFYLLIKLYSLCCLSTIVTTAGGLRICTS